MNKPLCLLFDSDGTLVDSEPLLAVLMEEVFTSYGLDFRAEQYMTEFKGVKFQKVLRSIDTGHLLSEDQAQVLESELRDEMEIRLRMELQPIPGIPEALEQLADYPSGVVSNGPERKIRCALESTGLAAHFGDNIFSAYSLNCWKPDPGIYLEAARRMGFSPTDCVVIEDALPGVRAALDAGMQVIHLNRSEHDEATPTGATCITSADQLPGKIHLM